VDIFVASLWYILSSAHSRSNLNDVPEQLHIGLHQLLHAADDLCCHTLPRDEFPELKDIDFLFFPAVDLSTVLSLVVLLVDLTILDAAVLRAGALALLEPFQEVPDDVLVLGPAVVAGRAEDKLGSLCKLDEGEPFVLPLTLFAGAVF